MSILTKDEILKEINTGNIEIKPFDRSQMGPASMDLRIGNEFSMFKRTYRNVIVDERASAEREVLERKFVKDGEYFLLLPNETVIAVTKEGVKLSSGFCGQLEGGEEDSRSLMDKRNWSILAHGTDPLTEEDWVKCRKKTKVIINFTIGRDKFEELLQPALHRKIKNIFS